MAAGIVGATTTAFTRRSLNPSAPLAVQVATPSVLKKTSLSVPAKSLDESAGSIAIALTLGTSGLPEKKSMVVSPVFIADQLAPPSVVLKTPLRVPA
jgi:hypothetical protein